jgi:hypothetical protein
LNAETVKCTPAPPLTSVSSASRQSPKIKLIVDQHFESTSARDEPL